MSDCLDHRHDAGCQHLSLPGLDRRRFLQIAALGGGAALLMPAMVKPARAAGGTDILLLTCMDYRLMHHVGSYMDGRKLTDKYDHVILAGASLGVLADKFPAWGKTFWDHLQVASDLHHIHKVMVIDHRDCGAYKLLLGEGHLASRDAETDAHKGQLVQLRQAINQSQPKLEVELLLMALDGSVEGIA